MERKIVSLILLLLLALFVFAADSNLPYSEERQSSVARINSIKETMDVMEQSGFSVTRLNDEFFVLRQIHENNLFKINNGAVPDFEAFNERAVTIEKIIADAYQVKDELFALNNALNAAEAEINISEPKEMYLEAEKEFIDERYEIAIQKIDATYEKIIELQGVQAKANAAYEAARKNISTFLIDNWAIVSAVIIIPLFIYLIFRRKIKRHFIKRKIESIEFEINVLKNEIKRAQEVYFVKGSLSEGEYSIKVKLYGEKIRDLNRQVAVLQEALEKLSTKRNNKQKSLSRTK